MRLVKLIDIAEIKPFDCGDDDLKEFLFDDARFYNSYPAVKIGRFAVSLKYAGRNIGTEVIDFIKRKLADNEETIPLYYDLLMSR